MTDMERRTFCAALSRYGAQAQITMVFEEMAELQDVLCKFLRGRVDGDTLANIAEGIADVGIMLDQMVIEFEVEDAVAMLADSIPAADVAPVVRCKDCKWFADNNGGEWYGCQMFQVVRITPEDAPKPDDFCSYGEQKDGGASNA